eukprot:TRINITY_DN111493_c0_g1_i1.p1 TRINITY_DN111493_c0_g1~~TRINITY_DN111493_c0_g1_i1.p1  ORF type:complete len:374 (-),score=101.58 TRINITY_DN111493_c0_g1_i1:5-1087(-)
MLRTGALLALLGLCPVTGYERDFNGTFTFVNKASGRRIVFDERGFYTADAEALHRSHMWRILPQGNATYVLASAVNGDRIYAQLGRDRDQGFYAMSPSDLVYQDQRWRLELQDDGSYVLVNQKSGRCIADAPWAGLVALGSMPSSEDSRWWLIQQEHDAAGPLLQALEAERQNAAQLMSEAERLQQEMAALREELLSARLQAERNAVSLQAARSENEELKLQASTSRSGEVLSNKTGSCQASSLEKTFLVAETEKCEKESQERWAALQAARAQVEALQLEKQDLTAQVLSADSKVAEAAVGRLKVVFARLRQTDVEVCKEAVQTLPELCGSDEDGVDEEEDEEEEEDNEEYDDDVTEAKH